MNARWHSAAEWLQRVDRNDVSDEEIREWLEWREQSRDNDRSFEEIQDLYNALRESSDEQKNSLRRLVDADPGPTWRIRWALAAGVIVAALAGGVWWNQAAQSPVYSTERGQNRAVSLPDGSELVLGGSSTVSLTYSGSRRGLSLKEGEAYFQVRHDTARPFVVEAGGVRITAVGTAFDVQHVGEHVTIAVSEGTVRVSQTLGGLERDFRLTVGEKTVVPVSALPSASRPQVRRVDPETISAWRDGNLQFNGEPLGAVVESVNRYSRRQIVLVEPDIAAMAYTGTVQRERADEWIDNLPQIFPVKKLDLPGGEVVLLNRVD